MIDRAYLSYLETILTDNRKECFQNRLMQINYYHNVIIIILAQILDVLENKFRSEN